MISTRNRIARPLRMVVLAVPGSLCIGAPASADTRIGADVSAGGTVDTNPYLSNGGNSVDVAGSLSINPWLRFSDDVTSLDLSGGLSVRQYSKSANGTDISGSAQLAASRRLSSYFSVNGGGTYQTSRNGINLGFGAVGPDDPLPPPTTPLPDFTLGGTRTRTQSMSANLGFSARLTSLDQLNGSVTGSRSVYDSPNGRDFDYFNAGLNYSRTLSDRFSATASIRYGKSNYRRTGIGDGTIITPEIGFEARLSPRITAGGSIGVSFSRSQSVNGFTLNTKSLSGQARLCRSQERGGICLNVARSAQPTALGSIETVNSASLAYNTRLSLRDFVSLNVSLNTASNDGLAVGGAGNSKYYTAMANWSHNFNRRFSIYASPSVSRVQNITNRYNSFSISGGLRYSIGAIS